MTDFTEVIKQKERMCELEGGCETCPLGRESGFSCSSYIVHNPQKAEKIIMDWANKNPVKTNADKFKEVILDTFKEIKEFGMVDYISSYCFFKCKNDNYCAICPHNDFWDREYIE